MDFCSVFLCSLPAITQFPSKSLQFPFPAIPLVSLVSLNTYLIHSIPSCVPVRETIHCSCLEANRWLTAQQLYLCPLVSKPNRTASAPFIVFSSGGRLIYLLFNHWFHTILFKKWKSLPQVRSYLHRNRTKRMTALHRMPTSHLHGKATWGGLIPQFFTLCLLFCYAHIFCYWLNSCLYHLSLKTL